MNQKVLDIFIHRRITNGPVYAIDIGNFYYHINIMTNLNEQWEILNEGAKYACQTETEISFRKGCTSSMPVVIIKI